MSIWEDATTEAGQYINAKFELVNRELQAATDLNAFKDAHINALGRELELALADAAEWKHKYEELTKPFRRPNCAGLMPRQSSAILSGKGKIGAAVHEINWKALEPTKGEFNPTVLAGLAKANQDALDTGINLRLRLKAGHAPTWLKPQMLWTDNTDEITMSTGVWWTEEWRTAWNDTQRRLAEIVKTHEAVSEVTVARGGIVYAEIMIRGFKLQANKDVALANGYTEAKDLQALKEGITDAYEIWSAIGVNITASLNMWQNFSDQRMNQAFTLEVMNHLIDTAGEYGVLMNNSIGDPIDSRGDAGVWLWTTMGEKAKAGYRVAFQTMTITHMNRLGGSPAGTTELCILLGASSVEYPGGWIHELTVEQAQDYNSRLAANGS